MSPSISDESQLTTGQRFRDLHESGTFLLANVGDAGTAKTLARTGVAALATSSAALAYSIGRSDAVGAVKLDEHVSHAKVMVEASRLPVNVDAENGYGHEPEDVADCIRRLAEVGAAGAGIEDWSGDHSIGIYDIKHAVARVEAALEAARALPEPFTVTGRTEILLMEDERGLEEALRRLQRFAEVGAPCLYAPGTQDIETVKTLVSEGGAPINVLASIGTDVFTITRLAEAGVRRVSIGGSLYRAQVGHAKRTIERILATGSFATDTQPVESDDLWG